MGTTTVRQNPDPGRKWWLPVLLALLIIGIIAAAYFATHPHVFGGAATATPTPKPAATATTGPTATPKSGPTGTPQPGPTGTPQPGPSATAKPAPTPSNGVKSGAVTHTQSQLSTWQQGANRNDPSYTFFRDPFKATMNQLPSYGFHGSFNIVAPAAAPAPTPTPYTNPQGLPEVQLTVQYQGKKYLIILDQPVQKGPKGIWAITTIKAV